jgi:hypothetical protein
MKCCYTMKRDNDRKDAKAKAISPDIMPCWSCGEPVGGEWYDGDEVFCDYCDEEGVATHFQNGTWACVKAEDDD